MKTKNKIELSVSDTPNGFQILEVFIKGDGLAEPGDLRKLKLPAGIHYDQGVVVSGKMPVWFFTYFAHLLHPSRWVATFDPRLGGIVTESHFAGDVKVGDIINIEKIKPYLLPHTDQPKSVKVQEVPESRIIAFVGPPNSGKSVFLNHLRRQLPETIGGENFNKNVFIIRACPDGEGDWFGDGDPELCRTLRFKKTFDADFVKKVTDSIWNVSKTKKMVLVDCGGKIDKITREILSVCTDAVLISNNLADASEWKGAIKMSELNLLLEIASVNKKSFKKLSENCYEYGKLERKGRGKLPSKLIAFFKV